MTNKEVAARFLRKEAGSNANMHSTGRKLYSYSTIIAQWDDDVLIGNSTKYSSTTSRHFSYIKDYVTVFTGHSVPRWCSDLIPYVDEEDIE